MFSLVEMLRYMRPDGCEAQRLFCQRFLEPVFGYPDVHGNYIKIISDETGQYPPICFTAHHDTVHKQGGMQNVLVINDVASVADPATSSCLGADCTTGIWLMLNMIEAGVVGTYVVHSAEEIGCLGSQALVKARPQWLDEVKAVISFDRYGDKSIITHQSSYRTASDEFAESLSDALGMPQLLPDDGGSYTDSNEYASVVSECTNVSVGYYRQHTSNETQDLRYANELSERLIKADWSRLVFVRDHTAEPECLWGVDWSRGWGDITGYNGSTYRSAFDYYDDDDGFSENVELLRIEDVLAENPQAVAKLLHSYGYRYDTLLDEMGISESNYTVKHANAL